MNEWHDVQWRVPSSDGEDLRRQIRRRGGEVCFQLNPTRTVKPRNDRQRRKHRDVTERLLGTVKRFQCAWRPATTRKRPTIRNSTDLSASQSASDNYPQTEAISAESLSDMMGRDNPPLRHRPVVFVILHVCLQ
jgi:hypothetical protein